MKRKTIISTTLALLVGASAVQATQTIRELWDGLGSGVINGKGSGPTSLGFQTGSLWVANPAANPADTGYIKTAGDFNLSGIGLPPMLSSQGGLWSDDGSAANRFTNAIWAVRQLSAGAAVNFNTAGTNYFAFRCRNDINIWGGNPGGDSFMGVGFADGASDSANFVGAGVTCNNYILGATDIGNSSYITTGTLGQAGLLSATNSGGPNYVRAYGTNKVGLVEGAGNLLVGRIITSVGGNTTVEIKSYLESDILETDATTIVWDATYAFTQTATMDRLLIWMSGTYPASLDAIRVGSKLADVVGLEQGFTTVSPGPNIYNNWALNLTNLAAVEIGSGPLTYQWQTNGVDIPGAVDSFYNVASATVADAGVYTCISTDPGANAWGSVTSAPVTITVTVDNLAPKIESVVPGNDLKSIVVNFSEPCNGAGGAGSYTLTPLNGGAAISISGVATTVVANKTIATLTTTTQPLAKKYTLTISGVTDLAGNALSPNTTNIWTDMYKPGIAILDGWVTGGYSINNYFTSWLPGNPNTAPASEINNLQLSSWSKPWITVGGNGNQIGARMYGFFIPPATGDYVFFCSGDDGIRVSLSTNADPANLCIVAIEDQWSNEQDWTGGGQNIYPTGPHRGDGVSAGPYQNRSDQFITAYSNSTDTVNNPWPNQLGFAADVVLPGSVFWPNLDSGTGEAKITLQAGQQYFLQAEYFQGWGGQALGVNYKLASASDPANSTATAMTGSVIGYNVLFAPTVSASAVNGCAVITFTGILQSAPTVNGTYTDVGGATSPYTNCVAPLFFRTHN